MPARKAGRAFLSLALLLSATLAAQELRGEGARLFQEGRFEEARQAALAGLVRDPGDADSSLLLCRSLLALGRPADAENYAAKAYALRRDPRFATLLGEATFALGRNAEALAHFQDYIAALPEGAQAGSAYYHVGEIYLRQARYGHADIALTAALQYAPGKASWWVRLGWAREKAGELGPALRAYEEALRLDPRLEDASLGATRLRSRIRG